MKHLLIITVVLCAVSCSTTQTLYSWSGYDDAVYDYTKTGHEKSVEKLTKIYDKLINNSGGLRKVPPPGVCADYGYLMIKKGEIELAKELLNKEIELYPESKPFIDRVIKRIER